MGFLAYGLEYSSIYFFDFFEKEYSDLSVPEEGLFGKVLRTYEERCEKGDRNTLQTHAKTLSTGKYIVIQ